MEFERCWNLFRMRLRSLLRRGQVETELEKELTFHVGQEIEANLAAGMAPAEAQYAAQRRLGGVAQIKEECRDMRRTEYLENVWQDLRYGARTLRKSPGFTAVVILTLALGIGTNTAIFSMVDALLLRPLPYPHAARLANIWLHSPGIGIFRDWPSPGEFVDLKNENHSFDQMTIALLRPMTLTGRDQPERITVIRTSSSLLHMLGAKALLGRLLLPAEDQPGKPPVALLTYPFWRDRFDSNRRIVGQAITLDGGRYTVAGVLPCLLSSVKCRGFLPAKSKCLGIKFLSGWEPGNN